MIIQPHSAFPYVYVQMVRSDASMGKYRVLSGMENLITHFWDLSINQSGEQASFLANHQVLEGLLILINHSNKPNLI